MKDLIATLKQNLAVLEFEAFMKAEKEVKASSSKAILSLKIYEKVLDIACRLDKRIGD